MLTIFTVVCILYICSVVLCIKEWTQWKEGFMENGKFVSNWYMVTFYIFRTGFLGMLAFQGFVIFETYKYIIA